MKRILFAALAAGAVLFSACVAESIPGTEDQVEGKTEDSKGKEKSSKDDYSKFHFYLSFSEPHLALAKKGSLTHFDLDDVDVDGSMFSYDISKKKIRFDDTLWLSEGLFYHMRLTGTYDVIELSESRLSIQQEVLGVKTIFSYHRR